MGNSASGIDDIMQSMKGAFRADKAAGIDAVIQYILTGEDGGDFYATINDGKLDVSPGIATSPKLTVTMTKQDFLDMASGNLSAMAAFTSGKLKLGGDMMLAMKLGPLFSMG
jgi:putative sterol carrier protein